MKTIDEVKNDELLRSYDKTIHDLRNARQVDVIQYELAQMDIAELKRKLELEQKINESMKRTVESSVKAIESSKQWAQERSVLKGEIDLTVDMLHDANNEIEALKAIIAEQNKVIAEKDATLARIGKEYEAKYREMIG